MTFEEWRTKRTNIISKMLDNPDKYGIYPTTDCFNELDAEWHASREQTVKEVIEFAESQVEREMPDGQYMSQDIINLIDETRKRFGLWFCMSKRRRL